jgi:4-amino-4-deoxy-L-arabinose transferase-like glycosyltransferase
MTDMISSSNDQGQPVFPAGKLFFRPRWLFWTGVALLFALGIGLRLLNLTNPPLDVHAFRVLPSLMTARGMYYQMQPHADPVKRQLAIEMISLHEEPPITERLVALTYLAVGGEHFWIFRFWTTLFWVIGGIGLFLLARGISSADGAILAIGFYFLLPFGNVETRAFLPEPFMVMWIIWAWYALYRWLNRPTWKWTMAAGVLAGMAILAKVFAAYFIAPAAVLAIFTAFGVRRTLSNPRFWVLALLMAFIPSTFYIFPNLASGSHYLGNWVIPFSRRLIDPWFYIEWLHILEGNFDLAVILVALASTFLLEKRWRAMCLGLWIGYGLLGASVPELIESHLYYNIPLIAVIAISLAPAGALVFGKLSEQGVLWRLLSIGTALVAVFYAVFMSRKYITDVDYRAEPARWMALAQKLPDTGVIGMTQDYNGRLEYFGWKPNVQQYPRSYDQDMVRLSGHAFDVNSPNLDYFNGYVKNDNYFVITELDQLDAQPYLKKILYNDYAIYAQSDWYIIFDLTHPK